MRRTDGVIEVTASTLCARSSAIIEEVTERHIQV